MDIIYDYIGKIDYSNIRTNKPPELIFLCGGNSDGDHFRSKFQKTLEDKGHNVILAEKAMDWQGGQIFSKDLLELEKYYAALVSVIPIICESYGSACELGAFVSDPLIRRKLFIIISEKFYIGEKSKSFIRWGPIKNYEHHEAKKIFCIKNNTPETDLPYLYNDLKKWKTKQESYPCDFTKDYFRILLLIDAINIFVVAHVNDIKKSFKKILDHADKSGNHRNLNKDIEEMLFVLEKLKLIKPRVIGSEKFYLPINNCFFLEYAYKKNVERERVNILRKKVLHEIYSNKSPQCKIKADILRDEKSILDIKWLKAHKHEGTIHLETLSTTLPFHYKFYEIDKMKGGKRLIAQPTEELKNLQRTCLPLLENYFPIHSCAKAYRKNENGILENIRAHQNNKYFFKFDFIEFFSSIKADNFYRFLEEKEYDPSNRINLLKLFFTFNKSINKQRMKNAYKSLKSEQINNDQILDIYTNSYRDEFQLSVGAPSSPLISNIMMYDFDKLISDWSDSHGITYSRYADDMTFSSKNFDDFQKIKNQINAILDEISYLNLSLNEKKEKKCSFKQRVRITGLILTPNKEISIGRDLKKLIRAMVHHFILNKLDKNQINQLKGWLAYCKDVEPQFYNSLVTKYTQQKINQIITSSLS